MVRVHASFELAAARLYFRAHEKLIAVEASPETIQASLRQAVEEVNHYEMLRAYHEKEWGPLEAIVHSRIAAMKIPEIQSEADFLAASWIFDFAGVLQMGSVKNCPSPRYRQIVRRILLEERGHAGRARRTLLKHLKKRGKGRNAYLRITRRWIPVALRCFGKSESPYDHLAVQFGYKNSSAEELRQKLIQTTRGFR